MDAGMSMLFISALPMAPAPDTFVQSRQDFQDSHASSRHHANFKNRRQKSLQGDSIPPGLDVQPYLEDIRPVVQNCQRRTSAAEEFLVDVLMNKKSQDETKASRLKSEGCLFKSFWNKLVIWIRERFLASTSKSKSTSRQRSPKPNRCLATYKGGDGIDVIGTSLASQDQALTPIATSHDSAVNNRVAAVDISVLHSQGPASICPPPSVESLHNQPPTNNTSSKPPTQIHRAFRNANIMSPENERKIDKVMERLTGINCRHGLGIQDEMDMVSSSSYGYGFYWTCCNHICAKARVMGRLGGGVMEVAVKGPVSFISLCSGGVVSYIFMSLLGTLCRRKNSLSNEKCGECGHPVCVVCEKVAECAKANGKGNGRVQATV
ncbi:hypothetical protein SBOR_4092 [Sclerotinia borealis F-4128]|uniref:Uncharacterized protein n=1 Tax=Sclerotinia borealis (strain F-4128) TaxID=1432307 RepID=W9CFI2_SCLBF|nr:hypothetical protein SBOR_4092 [Sclerotinia borealis F-4128]